MRTTLFALAVTALLAAAPLPAAAQDFNAMSSAELLETVENTHPAAYFALAAKLYNEGRREEAAEWLYIGQIRYRFHLTANPDLPRSGDPALFDSLMNNVGRPINEYIGGDFDEWLTTIDDALAWDEAHPNGFTDKTANAEALTIVRTGLTSLRENLAERRSEIESYRRLNGLPIR
jgi:hypothetical protein